MIHILIERGYEENNRTAKILDGISSVAKKRHDECAKCFSVSELPSDAEVVIVISQSQRFTARAVEELTEAGVHPLLFGFEQLDTAKKYSCISPNYTKSAYKLTRYLLSNGVKKCAVLGYNADSLPDRLKYSGIRQAILEAGARYTVFENRGNLSECLDAFAAECGEFDGIVCCNGNVAVGLYAKHRELIEGKRLCSCSALKICEFFDLPCTISKIDYLTAGAELARLYFFLKKEGGTSSCVMSVDLDTDLPDFEDGAACRPEGEEINFWGDKSLEKMELLDGMLSECDKTDISILSGLMRDETYEKLSEELFISVNTVKYRVRKMLENSSLDSKKELVSLLREYRLQI